MVCKAPEGRVMQRNVIMNSSESIKELATALSKAQAKMKTADKGSVNPHFKSKYASLEQVWEACREALTSEGLSVIQGIVFHAENHIYLETKLMHSSGEWAASYTPLYLPAQPNMQHLGSAVTYAKRISLMAIAGISVGEVDDDGEENRKAIEEKKPDPKPEVQEFTKLLVQLREMIKTKGWKDHVLEYAREMAKATEVPGIDVLRACVNDPEMFAREYSIYIRREKK